MNASDVKIVELIGLPKYRGRVARPKFYIDEAFLFYVAVRKNQVMFCFESQIITKRANCVVLEVECRP